MTNKFLPRHGVANKSIKKVTVKRGTAGNTGASKNKVMSGMMSGSKTVTASQTGKAVRAYHATRGKMRS